MGCRSGATGQRCGTGCPGLYRPVIFRHVQPPLVHVQPPLVACAGPARERSHSDRRQHSHPRRARRGNCRRAGRGGVCQGARCRDVRRRRLAWRSINAIRALAMDAVQKAKSGHPGTPMALAPAAYVLWHRFLRHDPADPDWPDRDRFVLSAATPRCCCTRCSTSPATTCRSTTCATFRQWGSKTPGHPEHGHTPGVETTTGPLGQGVGNAVGMAIAERFLAEHFNRPGHRIVDHHTWAFVQRRRPHGGRQPRGRLARRPPRLGKLMLIYDDNHITIDGDTALAFSDDVPRRFEAYGWHVVHLGDGNDLDAIADALEAAARRDRRARRSSSCAPTSPIRRRPSATPRRRTASRSARTRSAAPRRSSAGRTSRLLRARRRARPLAARRWRAARRSKPNGEPGSRPTRRTTPRPRASSSSGSRARCPTGGTQGLPGVRAGERAARHPAGVGARPAGDRGGASRAWSAARPTSPATPARRSSRAASSARTAPGRTFHCGIREHGMGVVPQRHGRPRRAPRLRQHVPRLLRLHAAGGPPRGDHAAAGHLRLHARLDRRRRGRPDAPADRAAGDAPRHPQPGGPPPGRRQRDRRGVARRRGTARRPHDAGAHAPEAPGARPHGARAAPPAPPRGAYVLLDPPGGTPQAILIATGSEVHVALAAAKLLQADRVRVRVVSMPSWELFAGRAAGYRDEVLPPGVRVRLGSRRRPRSAGSGGSRPTAPCSPWSASAPPRRATACSRSSGSRPSERRRSCGRCSRNDTFRPAVREAHDDRPERREESAGPPRRARPEPLVRLHHP